MLLTPQHRRSARITKKVQVVPKKETKIKYDLAIQCDEEFASDWNEKTQQRDIVEDDEELPFFKGYEYDKEYYRASSSYSSFVDKEIAALRSK
tara:strand:- start:292 stop:570 length:279 start_codon:yes stop_codon:yes gene_type:complete